MNTSMYGYKLHPEVRPAGQLKLFKFAPGKFVSFFIPEKYIPLQSARNAYHLVHYRAAKVLSESMNVIHQLRMIIAVALAVIERGGKCIVHFGWGRLSHGCERDKFVGNEFEQRLRWPAG